MAVKRWVWIVLGLTAVLVLGMIAFVGGAVYMFSRHVDVESTSRLSAEREFDQVRSRFAGRGPLIEVSDGDARLMQPVEREKPAAPLEALHVVVWSPDKDQLVRVTIPFWMVQLGGWKPVDMHSGDFDLESIRITPQDLERYGPGLVLDHRNGRGARVLVWTE